MLTLTEKEVIERINRQVCFDAVFCDGAFKISITSYVPYIATAIHAGSHFHSKLEKQCALSKKERFFEEDPYTDTFILGLPITLVANESRYNYDLNRTLDHCIYEEAWGKKVWKTKISPYYKNKLHDLHQSYYRVLHALVLKLESLYGRLFIFDIHSYNYKRIQDVKTPVFNIGSHFIPQKKDKHLVEKLTNLLTKVDLPNIDVTAEVDLVFQGKGYQAQYISENFTTALLFPIEVKKIYMDELTGVAYPMVIEALSGGLQNVIKSFIQSIKFTKKKVNIATNKKTLKDSVVQLDKKLFQLSKKIDVLYYVNPINYETEKKKFFQKGQNYQPQFKYRQLKIDPFDFREKLYKLPVASIHSLSLRKLYREVIESLALDVDLITSIGKESFFYNSLRVFGEPNNRDIDNAKFLLYAPSIQDDSDCNLIKSSEDMIKLFNEAINHYGISFGIKLSDQLIAKAMVDNSKKEVVINKKAKINEVELNALIHHEVGVHALTTINAELQPLSILRLGLPNNTHTQEGLAIYSEYLSGNLTLKRLKELALRVIAVDHMIRHQNFIKTYQYIVSNYPIDPDTCFRLVSRVYRGGGFTKDFLYLNGLRDVLKNIGTEDFNLLFTGKTSLKYLPLLRKMKEENWLIEPKHMPVSYQLTIPRANQDKIINYLMGSIR